MEDCRRVAQPPPHRHGKVDWYRKSCLLHGSLPQSKPDGHRGVLGDRFGGLSSPILLNREQFCLGQGGELRLPRQADRRYAREVAVTIGSPPSAASKLASLRCEFSCSRRCRPTADGLRSGQNWEPDRLTALGRCSGACSPYRETVRSIIHEESSSKQSLSYPPEAQMGTTLRDKTGTCHNPD